MNTWLSLIPPLTAIILAIWTRRVIPSLLIGVVSGALIIQNFSPIACITETLTILFDVVSDPGNARMLTFSLLIGSIVFLVERSGGVNGFVALVTHKNFIDTKKKAGFFTILVGAVLFIEGSISILTTGTVARPLFRKFKISREKLAYLADSTCAPIAVLIPINGWGAYLMTQFHNQDIKEPVALLVQAMPYFIYPIVAVILTCVAVAWNLNLGPMKAAEGRGYVDDEVDEEPVIKEHPRQSLDFIVPVLSLIFSLFVFMMITGKGSLIAGDGSKSILYGILTALGVSYVFYRSRGVMRTGEFIKISFQGMRHLLGVVVILALAFSMNAVCKKLQTGFYVSGILGENLPAFVIPAMIFVISAFIAFATGTSWGTFAIMLSVGIPVALHLDLNLPLVVGAIVSGGVWGDHCSPVSDTTVLASLASDCPLIDHVRTQLPYALLGGVISILLYLCAGSLL